MEVSGQLHAPAALPPGKEPLAVIYSKMSENFSTIMWHQTPEENTQNVDTDCHVNQKSYINMLH
jgi:hypothetical protein